MDRLRYVDDLIRRKATGAPDTLAKKLNLSKSHTLLFIQEMKELGFPIEYSRRNKSYYYVKNEMFITQLFGGGPALVNNPPHELTRNELRKINGGISFSNLFIQSDYIRLNDLTFEK